MHRVIGMNIIVVSDFYYPGNSRGLEEHCRQLSLRGHTVNLLAGTYNPGEISVACEKLPFETNFFPYYRDNNIIVRAYRLRNELVGHWREIENRSPADVVIFNQPLTALLLLGPSLTVNKPTVYVFHAPWAREWDVHNPSSKGSKIAQMKRGLHKQMRNFLEGLVLTRMSRLITLSGYMQNQALKHHPSIDTDVMRIVPGGVDGSQFHPADDQSAVRNELGLPVNSTIIFTLRRLIYRMGIDILLRSFDRLIDQHRPDRTVQLVVGGDGPERDALRRLAERLELTGVRFTGYIDEDQVADYYRAADLFVLPTRKLEGFGYVTLEALATGLPVLATRVGGTKEILEEFDPELFLPGLDPDDWAKKLSEVLDSEKLSGDYTKKCRQYALSRYSWEEVGDRLDEIVHGLRRQNG